MDTFNKGLKETKFLSHVRGGLPKLFTAVSLCL